MSSTQSPDVIRPPNQPAQGQPVPTGDVGQSNGCVDFESRLRTLLHLRDMALRRWERYGLAADWEQAEAYTAEMHEMNGRAAG